MSSSSAIASNMKPLRPYRAGLMLVALWLLTSGRLSAANYYLNLNGAVAGSGVTNNGVYDAGGINWTTDSTGGSATGTFAGRNTPVFSTGTDAASLSYTITGNIGQTSGGMIVGEGNVNFIAGGSFFGGGTVQTLAGTSLNFTPPSPSWDFYGQTMTFDVAAGSTITLNSIATASGRTGGAIKTGSGLMTITGGASARGITVMVNNGELRIQNGNALFTSGYGATVTVNNGGSLELSNNITVANNPVTLNGSGFNNLGALRNVANTNTYASLITLASDSRINADTNSQLTLNPSGTNSVNGAFDLTLGGDDTIVVSQPIVDLTSLMKDGKGTVTLTATNIFPGPTIISNGTLRLVNSSVADDITNNTTLIVSNSTAQLRKKFGTIEELNHRWGMAFWSQSYRNFEEVALPKPDHNPSALLDLYHFFSESFLAYAKLQTDCIKQISPGKIVTHNVCSSGFLYLLDLYKLGKQLDIVSLDNYPFAWTLENEYGNAADREYHPAMASLALSMTRGWKRAPFWVTEAQVGRTFRPRRGLPEPGILNAWTHQEIAHGAKAVLWFQWRQFADGIEHLQHAVLECDGQPRRRYFEIQQTIREIKSAAAEIENACPQPEVARLRDFHCDWALDDGHTHPDFRYQRHLYLYYRALFENHINAAVIHPAENLTDNKLVLAPSLLLMDERRAAHLRNYVEHGGTLILTVQSGLRNFDNVFYRQTLPAFLTELCGLEIEEQNALKFQDTVGIGPLTGSYIKSRYEGSLLFEIIKPTTAKPLFHYTDLWFGGTPAVTVNQFRKGKVYYIATVPSAEFVHEFIGTILPECGTKPNLAASSSPMVESVKSFSGNSEYLHLINYTREPQTAALNDLYQNLGDRTDVTGKFQLKPFGAAILKRDKRKGAVLDKFDPANMNSSKTA